MIKQWLIRDRFVYAPSQWDATLHCNVVSHWLGVYTKNPWVSCRDGIDPPTAVNQTFPHVLILVKYDRPPVLNAYYNWSIGVPCGAIHTLIPWTCNEPIVWLGSHVRNHVEIAVASRAVISICVYLWLNWNLRISFVQSILNFAQYRSVTMQNVCKIVWLWNMV